MRRAVLFVAVTAAACAADDGAAPQLTAVTPPYGPLVGGTHVTLTGAGFAVGTSPRVLVEGRVAPLVVVADERTLDVLIPPGAQPGDAAVEVWTEHGGARATGVFHYSAPPIITAVSPPDVLYDRGGTLTLTGVGFRDEGAGDVTVVVDGALRPDVEVVSDTTLTVSVPPGRPLHEPSLELVDARGRATHPRAFRYAPSASPGLLLFPSSGAFAALFDPAAQSIVTIPSVGASVRLTAVVTDARGDYWGVDRTRRLGRLDPSTQSLDSGVTTTGWYPALTRIGADYLALDRSTRLLGRLDLATGALTPLGDTMVPCCGSYGLASGDATYLVARDGSTVGIAPVDLATGALGTTVPLVAAPGVHVEDLRFFDGVLYATTRSGALITIDPTTGVTTSLPVAPGRVRAMEVFTPRR